MVKTLQINDSMFYYRSTKEQWRDGQSLRLCRIKFLPTCGDKYTAITPSSSGVMSNVPASSHFTSRRLLLSLSYFKVNRVAQKNPTKDFFVYKKLCTDD